MPPVSNSGAGGPWKYHSGRLGSCSAATRADMCQAWELRAGKKLVTKIGRITEGWAHLSSTTDNSSSLQTQRREDGMVVQVAWNSLGRVPPIGTAQLNEQGVRRPHRLRWPATLPSSWYVLPDMPRALGITRSAFHELEEQRATRKATRYLLDTVDRCYRSEGDDNYYGKENVY